MGPIIGLGFGIVLLLVTLDLALSFLGGQMGILKRTGALKAVRWALRSVWRGLARLMPILLRGRRPRIRRGLSRAPTGNRR